MKRVKMKQNKNVKVVRKCNKVMLVIDGRTKDGALFAHKQNIAELMTSEFASIATLVFYTGKNCKSAKIVAKKMTARVNNFFEQQRGKNA